VFQIKICGVTRLEDAREAWRAGADAIGLNFYDRSPRYLNPEQAIRWIGALPEGLVRVGVFVNADRRVMVRVATDLKLDAIQLHGDEPAEMLADLPLPVIRAFRLKSGDLAPVSAYMQSCAERDRWPEMILVDASVPGLYGGTGQTVDWKLAVSVRELAAGSGLVLAGGLTAENVQQGILAVRPDAVDTASGVEAAPGIKDCAKLRDFVHRARQALASVKAR
jgi:phosphoribosylanthranilate isomerase